MVIIIIFVGISTLTPYLYPNDLGAPPVGKRVFLGGGGRKLGVF